MSPQAVIDLAHSPPLHRLARRRRLSQQPNQVQQFLRTEEMARTVSVSAEVRNIMTTCATENCFHGPNWHRSVVAFTPTCVRWPPANHRGGKVLRDAEV